MSLPRLDHCTNCSGPLPEQEPFCPYCGQKNIDRKISLWTFFKEFLGEYTKLDAKLFKSIITLFTRPGFLTREYWNGRRKAYLRPTQLFLFSGILMFILANWLLEVRVPEDNNLNITFSEEVESLDESNIIEKHIKENVAIAKQNPVKFIKKLLSQLPISLLLVLPLYAFVVKLAFRKKSKFLVEHFVHLLHTHAFIFLLGALLCALSLLGIRHAALNWAVFGLVVFYTLASMKNVYQEKIPRLVLKFIFLGIIYLFMMPTGSLLISGIISLVT